MNQEISLFSCNTAIFLGNQEELTELFYVIKANRSKYKILFRLFHKYIEYDSLQSLDSDINFFLKNKIKPLYNRILKRILREINNVIYYHEHNNFNEFQMLCRYFMIIKSDIPTMILQNKIPISMRDELSDDEEPFWIKEPIYREDWLRK